MEMFFMDHCSFATDLLIASRLPFKGSYKLHVDGCTDSPTFTLQNPLFERQASNRTETPRGYSDPGISRGAGIALIVITVLLFVVLLALIGWVVFLYCC